MYFLKKGTKSLNAAVMCFVLCAMVLLAACGSQAQTSTKPTVPKPTATPLPQPTQVTVTATGYSYQQPDKIPAGLVHIHFVNAGDMPHQLNLVKLNTGTNFNDFLNAVTSPDPSKLGKALSMVTFVGGANTIDPGTNSYQDVILNLDAGKYASLCFVSGADGVPHLAKGMYHQFQVVGSPRASQRPHIDGEVQLSDFKIQLPAVIGSATTLNLQVFNHGSQVHEVALLKLASGKTEKDAINFITATHPVGFPPFVDIGGMGALQPGLSGVLITSLKAGSYVALCFVPDAKTGQPHFMLGMQTSFTVS